MTWEKLTTVTAGSGVGGGFACVNSFNFIFHAVSWNLLRSIISDLITGVIVQHVGPFATIADNCREPLQRNVRVIQDHFQSDTSLICIKSERGERSSHGLDCVTPLSLVL